MATVIEPEATSLPEETNTSNLAQSRWTALLRRVDGYFGIAKPTNNGLKNGAEEKFALVADRPPLTLREIFLLFYKSYEMARGFRRELTILFVLNSFIAIFELAMLPWFNFLAKNVHQWDMSTPLFLTVVSASIICFFGITKVMLPFGRDWYAAKCFRPIAERYIGLWSALRAVSNRGVRNSGISGADLQPSLRQGREEVMILIESISRDTALFLFQIGGGVIYFAWQAPDIPFVSVAVVIGFSLYAFISYKMGLVLTTIFSERNVARKELQTAEIRFLSEMLDTPSVSGKSITRGTLLGSGERLRIAWNKARDTYICAELSWIWRSYFLREAIYILTAITALTLAFMYARFGAIWSGDILAALGVVEKMKSPFDILVQTQRRCLDADEWVQQLLTITKRTKKKEKQPAP